MKDISASLTRLRVAVRNVPTGDESGPYMVTVSADDLRTLLDREQRLTMRVQALAALVAELANED